MVVSTALARQQVKLIFLLVLIWKNSLFLGVIECDVFPAGRGQLILLLGQTTEH